MTSFKYEGIDKDIKDLKKKSFTFYRTQDPGVPRVQSIGLISLIPTPCWDLTDVTLTDEDSKSILTDNANRAIQGNQAIHVINSLVCKIVINAISAI